MSRTYNVGYGKPPLQSRFKKGRSGNPAGRPKRVRTALGIRDTLERILYEPIILRQGSSTHEVCREEATILAMRNSALRGDLKACEDLVKMIVDYNLGHPDNRRPFRITPALEEFVAQAVRPFQSNPPGREIEDTEIKILRADVPKL
jgi:hypothetical protein